MTLITPIKSISPYGSSSAEEEGSSFVNEKYVEFGGTNEDGSLSECTQTGAFSLGWWASNTDFLTQFIISKGFTDSITYGGNNKLEILVAGSPSDTIDFNAAINTDTWYHFLLTRDGSNNLLLYINGTLQNDDTCNLAGTIAFTNICSIGGFFYSEIKLDELCLYSADIGQAGATALYGEGTPQEAGDPTEISNLVHYWKFGDGEGDSYQTTVDNVGSLDITLNNLEEADLKSY